MNAFRLRKNHYISRPLIFQGEETFQDEKEIFLKLVCKTRLYGCEGVCRVIWGLNQLDRFYQVKILKWMRLPKGDSFCSEKNIFLKLDLFDLHVYSC